MPRSLSEVDFIKAFVATALSISIGAALVGAVADAMGASSDLVSPALVGASSMVIGYLAFRTFVRAFIVQKIVVTTSR
jgi:hypothetical protein